MQNRDSLLRSVMKQEDKLAMAKLLDKAEFTANRNRPSHSEFMDPHLAQTAEKLLSSAEICEYSICGGYPGAERTAALFLPDHFSEEDTEEYTNSIFKVLEIKPYTRGSLTHRDYLGAVMSLGIRKEVTGDIIVGEERCSMIVLSEMSGYIAANLQKVGNTTVISAEAEVDSLEMPELRTKEIRTTVSSLRLDSICAPAFGLSRSKAAEFIRTGRVNLNWEISLNPDKSVKEGDTISLKGKGRAILEQLGGRTKKDRMVITLKRLV